MTAIARQVRFTASHFRMNKPSFCEFYYITLLIGRARYIKSGFPDGNQIAWQVRYL